VADKFINSITGFPLEYQHAIEGEMARRRLMIRAFKAYAGVPNSPMIPRRGEPDDSVNLAWARLIVDKGANWLFGRDVALEITPGLRSERAEEWLKTAWPMERRMIQMLKLAINGGIAGQSYGKIVIEGEYPRLVIIDPMTVTPTFSPDDIEQVVRYKIQYPAIDPASGKPITFTQIHAKNDGGTWTITDTTEDERSNVISRREYEWPFEFSQIVECQNLPAPNEYWGEPDLNIEILDLIDSAEEIATHTNKMVRIYANPVLWVAGLGVDESGKGLDITPGGVVVLPDPEMRLNVVEPKADIAGSLALYATMINDLHAFSQIPKIATDATAGAQIGRASGSAMRYHYTPLIERTETKRRTYGLMFTTIAERMLAVAGITTRGTVKVVWPELVPDPMGDIQRASALAQLGASKDTVLRTAGFTDPAGEIAKAIEDGGVPNTVNPNATPNVTAVESDSLSDVDGGM
jgi:hypothetical protein